MHTRFGIFSAMAICWALAGVQADDPAVTAYPTAKVEFKKPCPQRTELGEVWEEGQDGSKLFLTPDGHLLVLDAADVISGNCLERQVLPLSKTKVAQQLKRELGDESCL